jgi:hypothetical protein
MSVTYTLEIWRARRGLKQCGLRSDCQSKIRGLPFGVFAVLLYFADVTPEKSSDDIDQNGSAEWQNWRPGYKIKSFQGAADDMGAGRATVIRSIARLEAAGLMKRHGRTNPKGQAANEYQLILPKK